MISKLSLFFTLSAFVCSACGASDDDSAAETQADASPSETVSEQTELDTSTQEDVATVDTEEEATFEVLDVLTELADDAETADGTAEVLPEVAEEIALEVAPDTAEADVEPEPLYNLVVNELVVTGANATPGWIELRSNEGFTVDLGGYQLRDHLNAHRYTFAAGITMPAFGFKVIWMKVGSGQPDDLVTDFSLTADGKARLFAPDETTLIDETDWNSGDVPKGQSWGRFPDGTGEFGAIATPTFGKANQMHIQ